MRALLGVLAVTIFVAGLAIGGRWPAPVAAQAFNVVIDCGPASSARRTTLYFGMSRPQPKQPVSELDWQLFLRDEVTKRFPDGLTVVEATGQWRAPDGTIDREHSKVLILVHADTPAARQLVQAVIETYRKAFDQQSVLWESARVCVAA